MENVFSPRALRCRGMFAMARSTRAIAIAIAPSRHRAVVAVVAIARNSCVKFFSGGCLGFSDENKRSEFV